MFTPELPSKLRQRLADTLPGRRAQQLFSHELSYGRHFGPPLDSARQAAVLVLLRWDGTQWLLTLTRKQQGQGIHSGQICFAGGGIERGETDTEAALRECQEETGWAPPQSAVVGRLSPIYVYASNNMVSCIVAATLDEPTWQPDDREVGEILEVPLKPLCAQREPMFTQFERHGMRTKARCFRWQDYDIWGATSMMVAELQAVLTKSPQPSA